MKVLFVDLEYDYGIKARGPSPIRKYGIEPAFKELGVELHSFYYDSYLNDLPGLQVSLREACDKLKPDLIFFMLFRDQFSFETLDYLKSKFQTMNWFGDDTWRFDSFSSKYAPHFTYSITTDRFSIEKYKKLIDTKVILSQWAAVESIPAPKFTGTYEFDLSFVGGKNPFRAWFIQQIKKQGIAVECFGHGWANGSVDNDRMYEIFRHSKINLNLSNSVSFDLRYLLTSPKSLLHTFRSQKMGSQIKARNFEIPFAGGFQLTEYSPGLEDYFDVGHEMGCYSNVDDILSQIEFFLQNDELRETIREKGFQRARTEHGYSHRFKKIFLEAKF